MAIRLTNDNDDNNRPNHQRSSSSSGGSGGDGGNKGLLALVLLILFGLFRYPKVTLFLLVVGGTAFYFYGDPAWLGIGTDKQTQNANFAKGCQIDQALYDKVPVFEALDNVTGDNELPTSASLEKYAPRRASQGQQGSCVGWANSYAARTIVEAVETGQNPNELIFSPSFLYNQIGLEDCQGAYTIRALEKMQNDGLIPLDDFPYDESSCSRKPTSAQQEKASRYKIKGFNRLSKSGNSYDIDMLALKQNIYKGGPITIGMMVPPSFSYLSKELWEPKGQERENVNSHGGHAMCVIGYDDNKYGGAVQIMNSWGDDWGKDGLCWVKYDDFLQFCREAYAIYPTSSRTIKPNVFHLKLGLWLRESKDKGQYIALEEVGQNLFENIEPIQKGQSFKIAVNNSLDCYLYIFAMEADKSSTLLFPYAKTSPYFGVTGTRLFPKTKSFTADDVGNKDYFAVVASKTELDPEDINRKINRNNKGSYLSRVSKALGDDLMKTTAWEVDKRGIFFEGDTKGKNSLVMVFGINKE
jgi:hypothetical protein